ncbi:MAG: hypothetical protein EOP55_23860, partial [Sphingobacteriales bacterium]
EFGLAFYWKKEGKILKDKVQVIFKETGFYLTTDQLKKFTIIIESTIRQQQCDGCGNSHCRKFLLTTPFDGLELAVNRNELNDIKDLMEGTLFSINMLDYVSDIGRN